MPNHLENPSCDRIVELLEAFVDGELTAAENALVEGHCRFCRSCSKELIRAQRLAQELRSLPGYECPPRLAQSVMRQAAAEASRAGRQRPSLGRRLADRLSAAWQPALRPALAGGLLAAMVAVGALLAPPARLAQPEASPSAAELARAEAEIKLAFAYLGKVGEHAGLTVRDEVIGHMVAPTRRVLGAGGSAADRRSQPRGG